MRAGEACPDQPFQATITVLDQNRNVVVHFQTEEHGRFRIGLEPGTYTLVPEPPAPDNPFPFGKEQSVTVVADQFTEVNIPYDMGIR